MVSREDDAIYYYLMKPQENLKHRFERKQSTKVAKQKFINSNFPDVKTNLMKVADLIRVLNFFHKETSMI